MFIKLSIIFGFLFLSVGLNANAQTASISFTEYLGDLPGLQISIEWLFNILRRLTCYLFQFAIIAFGVMLIVYGIMTLKSRGAPQEVSKVKVSLTWGIVGGLVIFGAFTIILTLGELIGVTNYPILEMITCD